MPLLISIPVLVVIYLLLLRCRKGHPGLEHLRKYYYAHRGFHGNGVPENSLWAFRLAAEKGYGSELDIHLMKDGNLAVIHDASLKRTAGGDVLIEDLTTEDLTGYRLVAAPMLYMLRPGAAERLTRFVEGGGTLVCTCYTGRVDEDDLCFLGGFPGPLREVLGIWAEETDGLYDGETNSIRMEDGATYACSTMCDLIHPETARTLGRYTADFYAGESCVTVNPYGGGRAYYVATRPDAAFLDAFYDRLLDEAGVDRLLKESQAGVLAASRGGAVFVMNFTGRPAKVSLPEGTDALTGENIGGETELPVNGIRIVRTVPE